VQQVHDSSEDATTTGAVGNERKRGKCDFYVFSHVKNCEMVFFAKPDALWQLFRFLF
jgi:hypothetical protein